LPGLARAGGGPAPPEFVGVRVGFASRYKPGLWTPVELTLRGGTDRLTGSVNVWTADSDGVPCMTTTPEPAVEILPEMETVVRLCVRFGHVESSLRAEFAVEGRTVAEKTFQTGGPQTSGPSPGGAAGTGYYREGLAFGALIVQIGPDPLGLEEAVALTQAGGEPRAAVARLDAPDSLPTHWQEYEGVDAVLIATGRGLSRFRAPGAAGSHENGTVPFRHAQVEALDRWVHAGGTLVLCVGSRAGEILREGAPLARFAPGHFEGVLSLPQAGALEVYAKSQNPIPRSGPERGQIQVARLRVRGKIEAAEADLPLVVRTPRGFGQVVFLAADPDQPPLSRWGDRKLLVARLLDLPAAETPVEERPVRMHYGYSDIAGQLRSALDRYNGVRLVPFSVVALLAVAYILCIGPGDYVFLRRFLPRMEWTWLTFPVVILGLSGGAYLLAHRLKGDQLRVHQVDLIDVDSSGCKRQTSWASVFSPRSEAFNLAAKPDLSVGGREARLAAEGTTLAWLGLPGDGLGGMYQAAAAGVFAGAGSGRYAVAPDLNGLRAVPIQVWSSKSFTARRISVEGPGIGWGVKASLIEEGRVPRGTLTNDCDFPLCDCMLAYDRYLYDLGTIEPRQAIELGPAIRATELAAVVQSPGQPLFAKSLTGRASSAAPYDPASVDVLYILRAMTFFEAVDGRRRTGLVNDYQPFVDLSGQLRAGRAVLLAIPGGATPRPGLNLVRDSEPLCSPRDERTTLLRFVLEVREKSGK
jgi:hypothetical protein